MKKHSHLVKIHIFSTHYPIGLDGVTKGEASKFYIFPLKTEGLQSQIKFIQGNVNQYHLRHGGNKIGNYNFT